MRKSRKKEMLKRHLGDVTCSSSTSAAHINIATTSKFSESYNGLRALLDAAVDEPDLVDLRLLHVRKRQVRSVLPAGSNNKRRNVVTWSTFFAFASLLMTACVWFIWFAV